ncbi:Ribose import ATP-binding protein RbsA [subsurface metagenome]
MDKRQKILLMRHMCKSFSGIRAIDDVSLDLFAGEIHCLVGENGAGKSTLIKVLSGAEKPDKGDMKIFDLTYKHLSTHNAINLGIATIYQDVDLVDSLTVADNIFLGGELRNRFGLIDVRRQEKVAQRVIDQLKLKISSSVLVSELSLAQRQMIEIVKALHKEAKILIMDEPTSSLGREETTALMSLIRDLASKGIGIIYISHYLREVLEIGDRITVLKDGRMVKTYQKEEFDINLLVADMIGSKADLFYRKTKTKIGDVVLRVKNYTRDDVVKDVSFNVHKGEVFGIGGIVGSGRTELANLIFGIDKKDSGEFYLYDKKVTPVSPKDAVKKGLCMLNEDRKGVGLFLNRSVKENIGIIYNEQRSLWLHLRDELNKVKEMIKKIRIKLVSVNQVVHSLSGGNQQKSIVARMLLSNAPVFILDEPTRGVDIGSKAEIYRIIDELSKQGKSIIMISTDITELLGISDRIGVMRNGKMVKIIPTSDATVEKLLKTYQGYTDYNINTERNESG